MLGVHAVTALGWTAAMLWVTRRLAREWTERVRDAHNNDDDNNNTKESH